MYNYKSALFVFSLLDCKYPKKVNADLLKTDSTLLDACVNFAEKNGLLYAFILKLEELGISLNSESIKVRWETEKERANEFTQTLKYIDLSSKTERFDYIFIKNCNSVPNIPRDIDIFVRTADQNRIMAALERQGMRNVQKSITETAMKGNLMRVDFYTRFCYIGVTFLDDAFLWDSRITAQVNGVEFNDLANEANFLLLIIHAIYGHRSMSLLDFLHITNIQPTISIETCKRIAEEGGWSRVFEMALTELCNLQKQVFVENKIVPFPYLFRTEFVMDSAFTISSLHFDAKQKLLFRVTLLQDKLIYQLKDTPIYLLVKSIEPTRNLVNTLTASVKSGRRDRKSRI